MRAIFTSTHKLLTDSSTLWDWYDYYEQSFYDPIWNGNLWIYKGKKYRSLRLLKPKSSYKLERSIAKILADEILKEIDKDIINSINLLEYSL